MKREDLIKIHEEMSDASRELMQNKNADYAEDSSPFGNLDMVGHLSHGKIAPEVGIVVRMSDKLSRIFNSLFRPLKVKDETIYDTLLDMMNYCVLLTAKIRSGHEMTDRDKKCVSLGRAIGKRRTPPGCGPLRIYIAAPYTGDGTRPTKDANVRTAMAAQRHLTEKGHFPHCPHIMTDHLDGLTCFNGDFEAEHRYFLDLDKGYIRDFMDAILRLPGASRGADEEVELAEKIGLPIFHSLEEVPDYAQKEEEEISEEIETTACPVGG